MATFRIHEDAENTQPNKINLVHTKLNDKQQRSTFAVLNNIQRETRTHAFKTVDLPTPQTIPYNDENEAPKNTLISSDKFKSFNVAGHETNKNVNNFGDLGKVDVNNISTFREPLHEIASDNDTPLSLSEFSSPMSIEKSISIDAVKLLGSMRETFFEIEEYRKDIMDYLRESELRNRPKIAYMRKQPDINNSMRTILVDWLVEVGEEYKLQCETLCLAVGYIDRFLSLMSVVRAKLQLVGTAAMFIAAKYEEIYPPDVTEFIYITDHTYTKVQVFRMEQLLLKALAFDLSTPTVYTFLTSYATTTKMSDNCKFLAMYLCELSLLEADPYLQFLPSMISAAAIALAHFNLKMKVWSLTLEETTGYSLDSLKEIMFCLSHTHLAAVDSPQQAIQDKYKSSKFKEVSNMHPILLNKDTFTTAIEQLDDETQVEEHNNDTVGKITSTLQIL